MNKYEIIKRNQEKINKNLEGLKRHKDNFRSLLIAEIHKGVRNFLNSESTIPQLEMLCQFQSQGNCSSESQTQECHTVSRGNILEKIKNEQNIFSPQLKSDRLTFEPISIKKASTVKAFCNNHDKNFFKKIDQQIDFCDLESLNLLFYRGFIKEFIEDKQQVIYFSEILSLIKNKKYEQLKKEIPITGLINKTHSWEAIYDFLEYNLFQRKITVFEKEEINRRFLNKIKNQEIFHIVKHFNGFSPIAGSSIFTLNEYVNQRQAYTEEAIQTIIDLKCDFLQKSLRDIPKDKLSNPRQKIGLNIVPQNESTYFVFSFFDQEILNNFETNYNEIPDYSIRGDLSTYALKNISNFFIGKSLYEKLSLNEKIAIENYINIDSISKHSIKSHVDLISPRN